MNMEIDAEYKHGSQGELIRVIKPGSFLQLGSVDLTVIKPLIQNLSEQLWDEEDAQKANRFSCFHHTRHIIFRFIQENNDPRIYSTYPVWTIWKPYLQPIFDSIVTQYNFINPVYPKVMLARLAAGHCIDKHTDGAGSNLVTHKIHLPIQTNPKALFTANGVMMHLEEGYAYEVNNVAPHSVENQGDEDRIHLIFEVFDDHEKSDSN